MKRIVAVFILTLFMIGCNGSTLFNPTVGPYKYPEFPDYVKEQAEQMGHKNQDIDNPDPETIQNICSICHWIL